MGGTGLDGIGPGITCGNMEWILAGVAVLTVPGMAGGTKGEGIG